MIDEFTKRDIEKISYELLKSSKSLDVFPTPVDSILNYSDFVVDNKIDLLNIKHSFFVQIYSQWVFYIKTISFSKKMLP